MNTSMDIVVFKSDLVNHKSAVENVLLSMWIVLNVVNILTMQIGFALLEAGSVKKKHQKSILMKNVMDGCFGAIGWFSIGFGIYSGRGHFFPNRYDEFGGFFVGYAFAVSSVTIVSGAVAARMKLSIYIMTAILLSSVLYPSLGRIVWAKDGLLYGIFVDYAGAVVVHGMAGSFALVAAYLCGPRLGRFTHQPDSPKGNRIKNGVVEFPPSSPPLQTFGAMMLWIGWFSFNGIGLNGANQEQFEMEHTIRACVNTLLSSSFSATVGLIRIRMRDGYFDLGESLNCLLAGSVAITGCCAYVDTWAACIIGSIAGLFYLLCSKVVLEMLQIDDPLNASALHGGCGSLGGISTGIFHRTQGLIVGKSELFINQIMFTTVIQTIAMVIALGFLGTMKKILGTISCSDEDQILGLDFKYHDGRILDDLTGHHVKEYNATKAALAKVKARKEIERIQERNNTMLNTVQSITSKLSAGSRNSSVVPLPSSTRTNNFM